MQEINAAQRRFLKQQAHHLKPVMQMGKDGPTPAFAKAMSEQLGAHELIKVRILNNCLSGEDEIRSLFQGIDAVLVQKVGHIYTIFKQRAEDSWFKLPN